MVRRGRLFFFRIQWIRCTSRFIILQGAVLFSRHHSRFDNPGHKAASSLALRARVPLHCAHVGLGASFALFCGLAIEALHRIIMISLIL